MTKAPLSTVLAPSRRRFVTHLAAGASMLALAACSKNNEGPTPTPDAKVADADEALRLAQGGKGFTVGSVMAANTVYVFFDTTCPHCAHLWQASQPLLGKLKMVWMPLGLLRPQSGPQGATILSAADPAAAMNENEKSMLAGGGGITASASLDDAVLAKVKTNTDIFRRLGAESVPLVLFRHAKTGNAVRFEGSMSTEQLAAAVGI
ncbi:MAG: thioredoxin fold domain-containing protein [Vitreoscilla sp.]|nr:thioredoxin fold domain-containing protein [Burkholderiales bacterium]MBP6337800.1 thioredoxin fold domain-containing protein [Vitreoscilla sp.]